jgi:hypothetical protein
MALTSNLPKFSVRACSLYRSKHYVLKKEKMRTRRKGLIIQTGEALKIQVFWNMTLCHWKFPTLLRHRDPRKGQELLSQHTELYNKRTEPSRTETAPIHFLSANGGYRTKTKNAITINVHPLSVKF